MSVKKVDTAKRNRLLLVRGLLLAVFIGVLVFSFLTGKGHSILIDNKDSEDGAVTALDGAIVIIDGFEALEMYPGDRLMQKVKGQSHLVKVETLDGTKFEKRIALPLMTEMMLLSVPKMMAGKDPYLEVFVPKDVAPPPDEGVGNTNSFTSPDAVPAPDAIPAP